MVYNTHRDQFPTVIIAGMYNFDAGTLYEIEAPEEREAIKVSF